MEFVERTIANLKAALTRHGQLPPLQGGSEMLHVRIADIAAREAELLEIWEDIDRCVRAARREVQFEIQAGSDK
jgi:hypothetical protein